MRFSIRRALLTVAVLGAATCAMALYALGRPLAAANSQRVERARDGVENEVQRLRSGAPRHAGRPASAMFGMRSGYISEGESFDALEPLPSPQMAFALRAAVAESERTHDVVTARRSVSEGSLFVAAAPVESKRYAWAAYVMAPPRWTPVLLIVGLLLALLSIALVVSSIFAVVSVQRGAAALKASLASLSTNLAAPIPRSDVTELADVADGIAALAHDLADAQKALAERERLAVLGRVTAGVAHELRNPLALIKLRIDLVRRSGNVGADVTRELADVGEEVTRLDRLVNDLLTVAGRRTGERHREDLGELVRRRVDLMKPLADEKRVSVEVNGTAHATVDSDAIARAVDNLVKNAIEASPQSRAVRVAIVNGGNQVRVQVSDDGEGVPHARGHELFEPFFTTKPEGVGLGLALSRAIASAHGGSLVYRRDTDVSTFELSLPVMVLRS